MHKFRTLELSDPRFESEGIREVTFKSPALGGRADMTLWIPPELPRDAAPHLVILLHGVYGSHWAWTRKGGAHRTAGRLVSLGRIPPMVLAMPSDGLWGDGTWYMKHAHADYELYIVEEVPAAAAMAVPALGKLARPFIAGLSMGGFGALKLGAKFPSHFRAVSAHSPVTHMRQMKSMMEEGINRFGPPSEEEQSVLHWLTTNRDALPPFRFDCGRSDSLLKQSRALHRALKARKIPHEYKEFAVGHTWAYWETHLGDTLRFFSRCILRRGGGS